MQGNGAATLLVQRGMVQLEYESDGVGRLRPEHQGCCQVLHLSAATIPHDGGLGCDHAWRPAGTLRGDTFVNLHVAVEDCCPLRMPGKAVGTSPMRDYRALTPYVSVEPTPARVDPNGDGITRVRHLIKLCCEMGLNAYMDPTGWRGLDLHTRAAVKSSRPPTRGDPATGLYETGRNLR